MARTRSVTDRLGSVFGRLGQPATPLLPAMQHHTVGPPHTSSSSTSNHSPVQPFAPASENETVSNVVSDSNMVSDNGHLGDSNMAAVGDAASSEFAESWVTYTSHPIMGTPLQPWGQAAYSILGQQNFSLSDSAASDKLEGSHSWEGLPMTSSTPVVTARKEAVQKLTSNSSSLAAAIAEAEQAVVEETNAAPLVCAQNLSSALCLHLSS